MSSEDFLRRLPDSVVASGCVIPIRSDIARLLDRRGASSPASTTTAAAGAPKPPASTLLVETPALIAASSPDVATTTLRVRVERSLRCAEHASVETLIVKLFASSTLGDLRAAIKPFVARIDACDIITLFPRRAYTDATETLELAGLVPNATLQVRLSSTPS